MALLTSQQSKLESESLECVLPIGSLVYVTCYGPFRGLRGIIRNFDAIANTDAPLYFYLVAFHEGHLKEPLWVVHDDIAIVEGENVSEWRPRRMQLSQVEREALSIVAKVSEREQTSNLEPPSIVPREVVAI